MNLYGDVMEIEGLKVSFDLTQVLIYILAIYYLITLVSLNVTDKLCEFLTETRFGIKNIYLMLLLIVSVIFSIPEIFIIIESLGIKIWFWRIFTLTIEIISVYLAGIFSLAWLGMFFSGFFIFYSLIFLFLAAILGSFFDEVGILISFIVASAIMILWYGYPILSLFCRIALFPIDLVLISISILTKNKALKRCTSLCPLNFPS